MTPGAMAETDQARAAAATVLDQLTTRARAASADGLSDVEVWMVLLLAALDSPVSRDRMAMAMAEAIMRFAGVGQAGTPEPSGDGPGSPTEALKLALRDASEARYAVQVARGEAADLRAELATARRDAAAHCPGCGCPDPEPTSKPIGRLVLDDTRPVPGSPQPARKSGTGPIRVAAADGGPWWPVDSPQGRAILGRGGSPQPAPDGGEGGSS